MALPRSKLTTVIGPDSRLSSYLSGNGVTNLEAVPVSGRDRHAVRYALSGRLTEINGRHS
jgi:hypothetical protein